MARALFFFGGDMDGEVLNAPEEEEPKERVRPRLDTYALVRTLAVMNASVYIPEEERREQRARAKRRDIEERYRLCSEGHEPVAWVSNSRVCWYCNKEVASP